MAGPGVLLALGGLLAAAPPGPGGTDPPGDFEVEAGVLLQEEPQDPKCFSRWLHDLTCFWDSNAPPDPRPFRLQFRLNPPRKELWQDCPLQAAPTAQNRSRFWCSLPPNATVAFVPLELRVLPPPPGPPLHHRTLYIEKVVLLGPPQNVSAVPGGARGQLCVRWQPPPSPYLQSSLAYEVTLSAPGLPPRTVGVAAGRQEQAVGGLRGRTPYTVRVRARPDGLSYGGFWSPWSAPATAVTPPDVDAVTLGLGCLLALLLLALGLLALLGHRRTLKEKLWPPVPGPERSFQGLFGACGGNFQLWLFQGVREPWTPPGGSVEELPSAVEEVGPPPGKEAPPAEPPPIAATPPSPPPAAPTPATPPGGPSPASSFEYTLFDPGSALLCPPRAPPGPPPPRGPYANLAPPHKSPPPHDGGAPKEPLHHNRPPPPPPERPRHGDPPGSLVGAPPGLGPPGPPPPYVLCS